MPDEFDVGMRVLAHFDQGDPHRHDHEHPSHAQNEGQPPGFLALRFAV
ncbi:hypothetical protein [Brevundimonas sp.]